MIIEKITSLLVILFISHCTGHHSDSKISNLTNLTISDEKIDVGFRIGLRSFFDFLSYESVRFRTLVKVVLNSIFTTEPIDLIL